MTPVKNFSQTLKSPERLQFDKINQLTFPSTPASSGQNTEIKATSVSVISSLGNSSLSDERYTTFWQTKFEFFNIKLNNEHRKKMFLISLTNIFVKCFKYKHLNGNQTFCSNGIMERNGTIIAGDQAQNSSAIFQSIFNANASTENIKVVYISDMDITEETIISRYSLNGETLCKDINWTLMDSFDNSKQKKYLIQVKEKTADDINDSVEQLIYKRLYCPYVLKRKKILRHGSKDYILMEHMDCTLRNYLTDGILLPELVWKLFRHLIIGIDYCKIVYNF